MPFSSSHHLISTRQTSRRDSFNSTINLDESDQESVIEVKPAKASEKYLKAVQGKRNTRSSDNDIILVEQPVPRKKALRARPTPDIEEDFISLGPVNKLAKLNNNNNISNKKTCKSSPSQRPTKLSPLKSRNHRIENQANQVEIVDLLSNDIVEVQTPQPHIRPSLTAKRTMSKKVCAKAKKRCASSEISPKGKANKSLKAKARPAVASTSAQADEDDDCVVLWDSADILCVYHNIAPKVANNLITLFDNENTIPFIARYRRGLTNNMEAEQLRVVRDAYQELKTVKEKAKSAMAKIRQQGRMNAQVRKSILAAKSVSELDDIMAQFKVQAKGTLAERARSLGLEQVAHQVLNGDDRPDIIQDMIRKDTEGLRSCEEIETGIMHIIAEVISKHEAVLDFIRNCPRHEIVLESKKMRANKKQSVDAKKHQMNQLKFKEFLDYSIKVKYIRPHTALALNRGENLKILSIKIVPQKSVKHSFIKLCETLFACVGYGHTRSGRICHGAFLDAWDRLVVPAISRHVRSELTKMGEKESLNVFASNLKQILLMPPLKGATVLAIDPGFLHGCKIAVISPSGEVKHTDVIHPVFKDSSLKSPACEKLREVVKKYTAKVIALGDGTASAETCAWLGKLIEKKAFHPVEVSYTIVSERGASIYSCSPVAKAEFPSLDPNVISAVSIGRRLQEPLAELVKIEPKHLGVGMYQHDLAEAKLQSTLDEVVQECVSFVGVDLNTASVYLLQKVAGLNETKAKNLLQWRSENGPFTSRQQLLEVKGIGPKAYEQCAGFVRVIPSSRAGAWPGNKAVPVVKVEKGPMPNLLDSTNVHPEAYTSAMNLIRLARVELEDLGKPEFIHKLSYYVTFAGAAKIATEIGVEDEQAVTQLTEALTQGPAYDIRLKNAGPVFRSGCTKIEDVKPGDTFTGCVQNVTTFGAFVDIGVGQCGLLHTSQWNGAKLVTGERVEVKVLNVEVARKRIGLAFQS
ncbi:S1 RNA-binding domain-containing protein 1-like isoform X2 [Cloeon dipterum]|uniref:S1 RNA-binding domain-containing protein 1-like isoform X2 n=1 Tax=Cloeon dipterum TaxID=197152 RepID=UPI0032206CD9